MTPVQHLMRIATQITNFTGPGPINRALAGVRREAAQRTAARYRVQADELGAAIAAGRPGSRDGLIALADEAIGDMRRGVRAAVAAATMPARLAAAWDFAWLEPDGAELMDDPTFDRELRERIVADLHVMNGTIGVYELFFAEMVSGVRATKPLTVIDLAAGHGGFALAAALLARDRGLAVQITATDLRDEYLAIGREHAKRQGLPVTFAVQDALDLSNLAPGSYDVVLCTQALHHFGAGRIALMFHEATRVAANRVVFIDGCRSVAAGAAVSAIGCLQFGSWAFIHDGFVSMRRCFVPEELGLLARIGGWGDGAEASWRPPGHCVLAKQL
ncbi:MAG: methyltransferase domain-containing protein [Candidatus Schekmanbacteria bacterium]|nr:methyltransferase domain-containing protein [Candidatus Schekmanbacteria bacterium]